MRFIAAATLDMQMDLRDASNCGTDNLCLYGNEWPNNMESGTLTQEKIMTSTPAATDKPYVEIRDGDKNNLFFLASPCKADLTISMGDCQCSDYYPNDKIYTAAVIDEWGYGLEFANVLKMIWSSGTSTVSTENSPVQYQLIDMHHVPLSFPGQVYLGEDIEFDYVNEDGEKSRVTTYTYGSIHDDPVEFDAALRYLSSMGENSNEPNAYMKVWYEYTMDDNKQKMNVQEDIVYRLTATPGQIEDAIRDSNFAYQSMKYYNYEQGTKYKKCVKEDGILPHPKQTISCVTVKGTGYPDTEPNFCYEKNSDSASQMKSTLAVGEVVGGVILGSLCSGGGPTGIYKGYCAGNVIFSAATTYLLAGVAASDKWPNGLNQ